MFPAFGLPIRQLLNLFRHFGTNVRMNEIRNNKLIIRRYTFCCLRIASTLNSLLSLRNLKFHIFENLKALPSLILVGYLHMASLVSRGRCVWPMPLTQDRTLYLQIGREIRSYEVWI